MTVTITGRGFSASFRCERRNASGSPVGSSISISASRSPASASSQIQPPQALHHSATSWRVTRRSCQRRTVSTAVGRQPRLSGGCLNSGTGIGSNPLLHLASGGAPVGNYVPVRIQNDFAGFHAVAPKLEWHAPQLSKSLRPPQL